MTFCNFHAPFSLRRKGCPSNICNAASRLLTVSDGTNSAMYSYLANSPLVSNIVFKQNSTTRMTTTDTYDLMNRLQAAASAPSADTGVSFNYGYNNVNERVSAADVQSNYWSYQYDKLGQLTSANKYFWDNTPVAGQQFDYAFDTIGNRTSTQAGGDQTGANLRATSYTNNLLNQIVSRGVPGYADVMGLGLATNTVKVNGTNAYQKWEYFREQMGTNNSSAAQWMGINVTAPGQTTVSGNVFVAKNPETFGYDADGNLTNDGRWTYTWDGENRLLNMTSLTNAPTASQYKLDFTYDYMGRRIQKMVSTNNGTSYIAQYTNRFVYDGWNPVAILNPASALVASFVWGTDLSGSMQGAGGVGGLLAENIVSNGVHFVAYDGNGNVAALVNAATGAVSANYEYGPFGELIRATGPMAKVNSFMFFSKFYDWEMGLYYYGFRYYNPSTGCWPSRDPKGENGFDLLAKDQDSAMSDSQNRGNLCRFVNNDPVNESDSLGLWPSSVWWLGDAFGLTFPLVHQQSIRRAITKLTPHEYGILDAATVEVDTYQRPDESYMHAMRNGLVNETVENAKSRANHYVGRHLGNALILLCGCVPDYDEALHQFGLALHTIQDATSPPHAGFQPWYGLSGHLAEAQAHALMEDYDPGPSSHLDQATRWFWGFFRCPWPQIPSDFFSNIQADPPAPPKPRPTPPPLHYP